MKAVFKFVVRSLIVLLLGAIMAGAAFCVAGCNSTVAPGRVEATQASWDGNVQNSGFLGFLPDGSGQITANARARYNALISVYGKSFLPPLTTDAGIAPRPDGTFSITAQRLADFMTMAEKRRAGLDPKPQTP